ncbi:MAG: PIG-L family deacetylase [Candidatus Kapaibacteriota bacterium]
MTLQIIIQILVGLLLALGFASDAYAIGPKILIVTAHPDDETAFAATIYKVTHELNGIADILLVTNGEGGYKYSTLAEEVYHRSLTNESSGREALPTIRKKELMSGGAYIGLRDYHFMDEQDTGYTHNPDSVLNIVWDTARVISKIKELHSKHEYDFVFTLLPVESTHGHHKAATILALRAISTMNAIKKPIIVGCSVSDTNAKNIDSFAGLTSHPITTMRSTLPLDHFNRLTSFGFQQKLNYSIIVNWLIAEHKSQGAMQLAMGRGHLEQFWNYAVNPIHAEKSIRGFAELLRNTPFKGYQHEK